MATVVKRNGTDISSVVVSVQREKAICTGVGSVTLQLDFDYFSSISYGDVFTVFEEGTLVGTYNFYGVSERLPSSMVEVNCQDRSRLLQDYYVDSIYQVGAYDSVQYWIGFILELAGVNYSINTDLSGVLLADTEGYQLGRSYAYDILFSLCKSGGVYFYFDELNVCQIGKLSTNLTPVDSFEENGEIISIETEENDQDLRNRVVVVGNSFTGTPIYAERNTITPWNIDENDYRSTLIASPNIRSQARAENYADRVFQTYNYVLTKVTVEVVDHHPDIEVGDYIGISSRIWNGIGRVYSLSATVDSQSGRRTRYILNTRCPRLIDYVELPAQNDVYIGTAGEGVWKKPLPSGAWVAYNQGIETKSITDLFVANGIFVCTTADGEAYRRLGTESSWSALSPSTFTTASGIVVASGVSPVACSINRGNGEVYVGYTAQDEYSSWITRFTGNGTLVDNNPVVTSGSNSTLRLIDLEHNEQTLIMTAKDQGAGLALLAYLRNFGISKRNNSTRDLDYNHLSYEPSGALSLDTTAGSGNIRGSGFATNEFLYTVSSTTLVAHDKQKPGVVNSYTFSSPLDGSGSVAMYTEDNNVFYFVTDTNYHYTYTISTTTLSAGTQIHTDTTSRFFRVQNGNTLLSSYNEGSVGVPAPYNRQRTRAIDIVTGATNYLDELGILSRGSATAGSSVAGGCASVFIGVDVDTADTITCDLHHYSATGSSISVTTTQFLNRYYEGTNGFAFRDAEVVSANKGNGTAQVVFGLMNFYDKPPGGASNKGNWTWSALGTLSLGGFEIGDTTQDEVFTDAGADFRDTVGLSFVRRKIGSLYTYNFQTHTPLHSLYGDYSISEEFINTSSDTVIAGVLDVSTKTFYQNADWSDVLQTAHSLGDIDNIALNSVMGEFLSIPDGVVVDTISDWATIKSSVSTSNPYVTFYRGHALIRGSVFSALYEYSTILLPDGLEGGGTGTIVMEYTNPLSITLDTIGNDSRVEISKYSPTLVYSQKGTPGDQVYRSYTNSIDSFVTASSVFTPLPLVEIRELRNSYMDKNSQYTVLSGTIDTEAYQNYAWYVADSPTIHGLYGVIEEYSGGSADEEFLVFQPPSGKLYRLETSNLYAPRQYMFTSTSGNPSSFYQANPSGAFEFITQNDNIPSTNITMIRMDDLY